MSLLKYFSNAPKKPQILIPSISEEAVKKLWHDELLLEGATYVQTWSDTRVTSMYKDQKQMKQLQREGITTSDNTNLSLYEEFKVARAVLYATQRLNITSVPKYKRPRKPKITAPVPPS